MVSKLDTIDEYNFFSESVKQAHAQDTAAIQALLAEALPTEKL